LLLAAALRDPLQSDGPTVAEFWGAPQDPEEKRHLPGASGLLPAVRYSRLSVFHLAHDLLVNDFARSLLRPRGRKRHVIGEGGAGVGYGRALKIRG
jgi:hypothetical protein